MIKWGVIGCGRIANSCTIPGLLIAPHAKLVAFMDTIAENAKSTAERFGVAQWYSDIDEFLSTKEIDAVYIAVPNAFHAAAVKKAASYGKHVLCEKPLGLNVKECEEMIAACKAQKVQLMVAQMSQFNNYNRRAKEIARSGVIGEVVVARASFAQRYDDIQDWRFDYQLSGGGALMDIGVYCIHTLRDIIGGKVVEVYAHIDQIPQNHKVDLMAMAILKFDNGALASVDTGFTYYNGTSAINEVKIRGEGSSVEISGTKGLVGVSETFSEGGGGNLWAVVDGGKADILVQAVNPYAAEMAHATNCLEKGLPSELDGTEGMEDVRVLMAIYESGKAGKPVRIA
jgi:D-xylose 1-dehydrogenase (NADP+, D-xylono-1,5-lactone-forming)